jgi:RNA-directed DNA polymerase
MQKLNTRLFLTDRPATFAVQMDGQETVLYNFNIEEGIQETETGQENGFYYDSLRVNYPLTQRNVLATLLTALYPANVEAKLQNDYNAAVMLLEPPEKKQSYIAFLEKRKALKEMVIADCEKAGVPEKLIDENDLSESDTVVNPETTPEHRMSELEGTVTSVVEVLNEKNIIP